MAVEEFTIVAFASMEGRGPKKLRPQPIGV